MWKSTLILIMCSMNGVLPRQFNPTTTRLEPGTALKSMTSDLLLKKCKIPENDGELLSQLGGLRICSMMTPDVSALNLDSISGGPFVCYAIHNLFIYWCDTLQKQFSDLVSAIHKSKFNYIANDTCSPRDGSLLKALKPMEHIHVKAYVERLRTEFESPEQCRKICFQDDKILPICEYLLIIDAQSELSQMTSNPNINTQIAQKPMLNNTSSNETNLPKVKEEIIVQKIESSPVEITQENPHLKFVEQPVKTSEIVYDSSATTQSKEKTPSVPLVTDNKNEILQKLSAPALPVQEKSPNDYSHEDIPKHANPQMDVKNIMETNIQSKKPENPQTEVNVEKPNSDIDQQKAIPNPNIPNNFEKEDYPDDPETDEVPDENEQSPINSAPNKDVQLNIFDQNPHDNSKDKIDIITQSRANDAYHTGIHFEAEDSSFFTYFLFAIGVFILGYVIFHNKHKVLGLLVEGRRSNSTNRRRGVGSSASYRKLDCTLEEAVSSTPPSHGPNIVY